MKLSKISLINKFKNLEKFKDQKWFSEESLKSDCNYKELPLHAAKVLINDMILFTKKTKFSNTWELCHSVKIRLEQIRDLLDHFCEENDHEKTLKGSNLHQQDTTHY
jgi:hypothetical protein